MPKKSPHPHVVWRSGRPRFSPGPELRAEGYVGMDLLHDDGRWYTYGEAIDWSRKFCENLLKEAVERNNKRSRRKASIVPRHPPLGAPVNPATTGYVYFLWVNDRIKIGFSTKPAMRLATLQTGTGHPIRFMAVIPGTMADERALHDLLRGRRAQGEWFKPTLKVIRVIQREIEKAIGPLAAPSEINSRARKQVPRTADFLSNAQLKRST